MGDQITSNGRSLLEVVLRRVESWIDKVCANILTVKR